MALIKHGNNALSSVTAFPSAIPTGQPVLLSTATASSSSSIEFTSGIDSTYDIYKWEVINWHPSNDGPYQSINFSTDSGSTYAVTKTSTSFWTAHDEADTSTQLDYQAGTDLAQSTANQHIMTGIGNDNDQSGSGTIYLFAPSSSTYVKHYICDFQFYYYGDFTIRQFTAGYCNTTSPVNAIKFVMGSGNIDVGTFKMYGISA